jgi:hypothetical protein
LRVDGHYDVEADIAWVRFESYEQRTAVAEETDAGLREFDPSTGEIVVRYVAYMSVNEEGARRDEHPLVTLRDGPVGRRAGLLGAPDVWEVVMWVEDLAAQDDPVAALVEDSILTRSQVDAALRYRVAYPDEIAARIELHRSETVAAETN